MIELKDIVRYSIFRLFSDLIRADEVVAEEEINFLNQVCNTYGITSVDRENSLNVPLGDAISMLSKQRSTIRCKIVEDLKRMSLSDGFCCREEALILMAATSCLEKDDKSRYEVVSSPCFNIDFDDSQVIYLESRKAIMPILRTKVCFAILLFFLLPRYQLKKQQTLWSVLLI